MKLPLIFIWTLLCFTPLLGAEINTETIESLPVMLDGRIAPLDSFARKFADKITGRETPFKMRPTQFLLQYLRNSSEPFEKQWILIEHVDLKRLMALDSSRKYFSFKEITTNEKYGAWQQELLNEQTVNSLPPGVLKAFDELFDKMMTISNLFHGESLYVLPPQVDSSDKDWHSLSTLRESDHPQNAQWNSLLEAYNLNKQSDFDKNAAIIIKNNMKSLEKEGYDLSLISKELHYNKIHPFRISWIFYLLSLLVSLLPLSPAVKKYATGLTFFAGFLMQTYGLVLRTIILGRPPVSNMYESVVFVAWCVLFFLFFIRKLKIFSIIRNIALICATLILIMADLLPLTSDMGMIEAVLRSNYWLVAHVLVIVSSYGAFALAAALAHYHLFKLLRGTLTEELDGQLETAMYRTIQVGTVLLGAGTILGGVWANESWGRFWGWDPKETWALITFLGYMALLHLKAGGWLRSFGMSAGAVFCFLLVLMTWYGVNFLLGTGLHSYGFGNGGTLYAVIFVAFELFYLILAYEKHCRSKAANS